MRKDARPVRSAANANVTPLVLDITDAGRSRRRPRTVEQVVAQRSLAGLVNNAGIVKAGPLELQPLDDARRQLEVNLIDQFAVIQAFLPLIRRARERDRQRRLIGGLFALPIQGAYSASKFEPPASIESDDTGRHLRGRAQPLEKVVADAQRVGHRGQRRVHGPDAREEARVDDVEIVDLIGPGSRCSAP